MKAPFVLLLFVLALAPQIFAHICLLDPVQRGGYDVSSPGNFKCFWPSAPCGPLPAEAPQVQLVAGSGFAVLLQQNLNHYNPGLPGFIDVAIANGSSPKNEDFKTLAMVPDYWPWLQATQTNYSIHITVPDITCEHCTLRVRYHPNKPTEPVFHNCADVSIVRGSGSTSTFGKLLAFARFARYPFAPVDSVVNFNYDGTYSVVDSGIGVRSVNVPEPTVRQLNSRDQYNFISEGLVAVNRNKQQIHYMGWSSEAEFVENAGPSTLITFDAEKGQFLSSVQVPKTQGSQWVSLVDIGEDDRIIALELVGPNAKNEFKYQYRYLSVTDGSVSEPMGNFPLDQTYVNFFWADFDKKSKKLYVFSGDENSLFELNARLFTVDTNTQNTTFVNPDKTQFTFTAFHVNQNNGLLFAMSPGLFKGNVRQATWSLVMIDPVGGAVKPVAEVAASGTYSAFYGGGIYGQGISDHGVLLHRFQSVNDRSWHVAGVDTQTGKVVGVTALDAGVNSESASFFDFVHLSARQN